MKKVIKHLLIWLIIYSCIIICISFGWMGLSYAIKRGSEGITFWNYSWKTFEVTALISLFFLIMLFLWFTFAVSSTKKRAGTNKTEETLREERLAEKEYKKIDKKDLILLDNKIGVPINELKSHAVIAGTTRFGKTVTLERIMNQCQLKIPNSVSIMIDGKGDPKLIEEMADQETFVWTMDGDKSWNPVITYDVSKIVDKLSVFFGDHQYFRGIAIRYSEYIIRMLIMANIKLNVPIILSCMNKVGTEDLIKGLKRNYEKNNGLRKGVQVQKEGNRLEKMFPEDLVISKEQKIEIDIFENWINALKPEDINGMSNGIYNVYSAVEKQLNTENNLLEIISKYKKIIFSLNSLKNSLRAGMLGELLIQDLKELITEKPKEVTLNIFLDELNIFVSEDFINLLNKAGGYNVNIFLAFQTIDDLYDRGTKKDLLDQVFGNISTLIVHKSPSVKTREYLSKTFGTIKVYEKTAQIDYANNAADKGSKKEVNEFIVHPDNLIRLKKGEVYAKIPLPDGQQLFKKLKVKMEIHNLHDKNEKK